MATPWLPRPGEPGMTVAETTMTPEQALVWFGILTE